VALAFVCHRGRAQQSKKSRPFMGGFFVARAAVFGWSSRRDPVIAAAATILRR